MWPIGSSQRWATLVSPGSDSDSRPMTIHWCPYEGEGEGEEEGERQPAQT